MNNSASINPSYWKPKAVKMLTLLAVMSLKVVVIATHSAVNDNTVGIMLTQFSAGPAGAGPAYAWDMKWSSLCLHMAEQMMVPSAVVDYLELTKDSQMSYGASSGCIWRNMAAACCIPESHILAWTKWPPFCRWHFYNIFLNDNVFILIKMSVEFVFKGLIIQRVVGGVYWFHSVRPSVRPSVCPSVRLSVRPSVRRACRVRSVSSTVMDGFFSY